MSAPKEPNSRSASHHQISMASSNLPLRQPNQRHHNHSVSMGSIGQTHRVTRRKSLTTSVTNMAAVAAAIKEAGNEGAFDLPSSMSHRRSMILKSSKASEAGLTETGRERGNYPSPPGSLPRNSKASDLPSRLESMAEDDSAIFEGAGAPSPSDDGSGMSAKARMRRASEGSHLVKSDGKRISGGELRCEKCGKGYKHSSCLTKHLWEHTPEWSYTSKLLISKHQQVQLLEAASVLVSMNLNPDDPSDSSKDVGSDNSSTSPAASGSSGLRGGMSSTDTTPPPQTEDYPTAAMITKASQNGRSKRYSSSGSFSRSYQSAPGTSIPNGSIPQSSAEFGSILGRSRQRDQEDAGLAAAVELLSCSFGTPRSGPVNLPPDVPPVPPLPARFMVASGHRLPGSTATASGQRQVPFEEAFQYGAPSHYSSHERESKMVESEESAAEDEFFDQRSVSRGHSDEDDDGVFGRMEE